MPLRGQATVTWGLGSRRFRAQGTEQLAGASSLLGTLQLDDGAWH
jgi:hypothetical protein